MMEYLSSSNLNAEIHLLVIILPRTITLNIHIEVKYQQIYLISQIILNELLRFHTELVSRFA